MSVFSSTSFGPVAETYVRAASAREYGAGEGTKGAADTDSPIPFIGETIKKGDEAFSPKGEFFDLSKYKKGMPIPPHSICA